MSVSDLRSDLDALVKVMKQCPPEELNNLLAEMSYFARESFRIDLLKLYDIIKVEAWKAEERLAVLRAAAPKDAPESADLRDAAAALARMKAREADDEDDWEEVYNSTDERNGEPRLYLKNPGTFYQTYGNGGGEGGHGGYWVQEGGGDLWSVAGDEFTYHPTWKLLVRPQNSLKGQVAGVRVIARKNLTPT